MSKNALDQYFMALERLMAGRPINISKGYKITNSSVALEAGRSKGSIKKSRVMFHALIAAIELAGINQSRDVDITKLSLDKYKARCHQLRDERDGAIAREISLLYEVYRLKQELRALTGQNILPIRAVPIQ